MEIVMLIVGVALGVLVVPPKLSGTLQRSTRRKLGELMRNNKNGGQ